MTAPLCIAGMGMVTAVGHTAEETSTSVDSGIQRFRETPIIGLDGRRLVASLVMPVSPELTGLRRARALAEPALAECAAQANDAAERRTALLLCIPPAWSPLLATLARELDKTHHQKVCALVSFETGHAAGIAALLRAAELLESGLADQCILGGVDSAGERAILEHLDALDQVKSSRVPHGIIPGEAAAFLCMRRAPLAPRSWVAAFGSCVHEHANGGTAGEGLTSAVAASLSAWDGDPRDVAFVTADLNGNREVARGAVFATLRTLWRSGAIPELIHPADRLGDVGAASAPLLLGLAVRRLLTEPRRRAAMVLCSSTVTLRGAAIVTTNHMEG